ncbi:MAG: hypothetical protein LBS85_08175 [Clostridiales Family XIII bacterium]|jgi:hypothetical protein|nr:hypothetical protein [Clostridiales Family XIII bacterium]
MALLLSHWHCIVPAAAILIGMYFMNRGKPQEKKDNHADRDVRAEREIEREIGG